MKRRPERLSAPQQRAETEQEQREKEPIPEVARVFLFQSISPEQISDTTDVSDPENICFTRMMLIRKGGIASRGKVMPVGGNLQPGERAQQAAIREVVEETHLRMTPASTEELSVVQEYSFYHAGKKETLDRKAHFFVGRVLPQPLEQAYPLHNEEDKIAAFDYLTVSEYEELAEHGTIQRDDQEIELLDSLVKNDYHRAINHTETDQQEVEQIHIEVNGYFKKIEALKKLQVLQQLIRQSLNQSEYASVFAIIQESYVYTAITLFGDNPLAEDDDISFASPRDQLTAVFASIEEHVDGLDNDNLDYIENAEAMVDQLWSVVQESTQFAPEDVRNALHASNTRATIENVTAETYNDKTGSGLPSIQLLFPLLTDSDKTFGHGMLRVLAENPQTARLLHTASVLQLFDAAQQDPQARKRLINRVIGPYAADNGEHTIYLDDVKRYIVQKGYIVDSNEYPYDLNDRLNQLGGKINRYFERLKRAANIREEVPIDQLNEIKNASFDELLSYAFGTHEDYHGLDKKTAAIYRWEARRKLMLIQMLHEIDTVHRATINRGVKPIDDIERSFRLPGISEDGVRTIQCEGTTYRARIIQRQKDLMQLLRKSIVRDEGLPHSEEFDPRRDTIEISRDIYGEAYIFMDEDLPMQINEYPAPPGMTDGKDRIIETYRAPKVLHDLISSIVKNGGDAVRISQYKELPADGKGFDSKGSGGGGKIRMAKFYIEYTDDSGMKFHKEVQCFFPRSMPGPNGIELQVTGQYDFLHKKGDDKDYGVSRLFKTRSHRSFMESLYPASVYGDSIQPAFKGQV